VAVAPRTVAPAPAASDFDVNTTVSPQPVRSAPNVARPPNVSSPPVVPAPEPYNDLWDAPDFSAAAVGLTGRPVADDRAPLPDVGDDFSYLDSDLQVEPPPSAGDPTWSGAAGVTNSTERAHEKGPGKWTETGRTAEELASHLPAGPSRPLRLDDSSSSIGTGWVVAAIVGLLVIALLVAFWPA
jgi:hypothetical protein